MAIQTSCPHCDTSYNLPDDKEGKTVRCKKCEEPFTVRDQSKARKSDKIKSGDSRRGSSSQKEEDDDQEDEKAKKPRKKPRRDDDDDDDDDRGSGKKKKKSKKKEGSPLVMILIGVGVLVVLICIGVGVFFFMQGDSTKDKNAKKSKTEKKVGEGGNTPEVALPADDPVNLHFKMLEKDLPDNRAEVLKGVLFFLNEAYPKSTIENPRKPGTADHPWRSKVFKQLELLLRRADQLEGKPTWEAFAKWAAPTDLPRLKMEMKKADTSEYKRVLLEAIAKFKNEAAAEFLLDQLESPEKVLAKKLLQEFSMDKDGLPVKEYATMVVRHLFPKYYYHPDLEVHMIALELLEYYNLRIEDPLYSGPVSGIPRLPRSKENLTFATVVPALKGTANKEDRLKQLMALDWLQKQTLSDNEKDWTAISGALNPMINANDFIMRQNALICLETWGTKGNISTLEQAYKSKDFKADRPMIVNVLKRIRPEAEPLLIRLWPDMDPVLRASMSEYILSISNPTLRLWVLNFFNDKTPDLQAVARTAVTQWNYASEAMEQCMKKDLGQADRREAALDWLQSQPAPADLKLREQYLRLLDPLVAFTDPNLAGIKAKAQALKNSWAIPKVP